MREPNDYSLKGRYQKATNDYMSATPDGKVGKINVELVREINEYFEEAEDTKKELSIIVELMKKEDERDYKLNASMIRNTCRIIHSISGQQNFSIALKKQLIKNGIHDKFTKEAINYTINSLVERINYIRNRIVPTYLDITPFSPYVKQLAQNRISISEDMHTKIDFSMPLYENSKDYIPRKEIAEYVAQILLFAEQSADTEYVQKREAYRNANYAHLDRIAMERLERENDIKKDAALKNQKRLNTYCKRVETSLYSNNANNFLKNQVYKMMVNRMNRLPSGGSYRIIGVIPSKGTGKGQISFVRDEYGHRVGGITSSKIFSDLSEVNQTMDAIEMSDPYAVMAFIQIDKEIGEKRN